MRVTFQMLMDWARALKELDRPARAAEAYARAAALEPRHPKVHFKLAMVLRQLGRREGAVERFRCGAACGGTRVADSGSVKPGAQPCQLRRA